MPTCDRRGRSAHGCAGLQPSQACRASPNRLGWIDGQVALAEAGRRNGVRRILPSDYALDLFKAIPGEHLMFDLRRTADARIADTGIEHIHVLQGAFMEMFSPGMGTIDYEAGAVTFWGDARR